MRAFAAGRLRLMSKWYVLLFIIIGLLVTSTVIFNTVTDSWGHQLKADAEDAAHRLEASMADAVMVFDFCFDFFSMYVSDLSQTHSNEETAYIISKIFSGPEMSSGAAHAYFYHINYNGISGYSPADSDTVLKLNTLSQYEPPTGDEPVWRLAYNAMTGTFSIVYIKPLITGEYSGYIGLEFDTEYLRSIMPHGEDIVPSLLTPDGRVIIGGTAEAGTKISWVQRYSDYAGAITGASGVTRVATIEGVYAAAHIKLESGHIFMYETPQADVISQNLMLILFFLLCIACILLLYMKDENGALIIDLLCDRIFDGDKSDPQSATRARVALLLHLSFLIMLLYRLVSNAIIGAGPVTISALAAAVLAVAYLIINFKYYIKHTWITAIVAIIAPPVISGLLMLGNPDSLAFVEGAWTFVGVIGPIFIHRKRMVRLFFPLFSVMLFATLFVLAVFLKTPLSYSTYVYFSNLFFVGLTLSAAASIYAARSDNDYNEMSDTFEKLRNAQSSLVQHEKMVTLGKLIAGVAHEINTPIGAIKASAEISETAIVQSLREVFEAGGQLDDKAFESYARLLEMAAESFKEMRTTSEMRKARPQIRAFLKEMDVPDSDEVQQLLERMEICDIEKIECNLNLFASPKIIPVMRLAIKTLPLISAIQTTLMATTKVSKIVFALKTYAHSNPSGERTETDVQATIETVLMLYHNQIKQSVNIVQDYEDGLPGVLANADELSQVWTNMIQNALHAMDYNGTLTLGAHRRGDMVAITIADTGCGISPEHQERIFDPFYTTKPMGEGSGLGLDICRRIVRDHGGELTVSSAAGKGTEFTIALPIGGNYAV